MSKIFELKYINFPSLSDKIQKKSEQLKLKELQIFEDKIEFDWNNSFLGLPYKVVIMRIDDKSVIWSVDMNGVIGLLLVLALVLFLLLKSNLIVYFLSLIVIGIAIYVAEKQSVSRAVRDFLHELDKKDVQITTEQLQQTNGLRCPACGESLTEYDEVCPSCGLYLGKTWKKQPAHRTGLYDVRLVYQYKKKTNDKK